MSDPHTLLIPVLDFQGAVLVACNQ
jgi:hypothetical protein